MESALVLIRASFSHLQSLRVLRCQEPSPIMRDYAMRHGRLFWA